MSKKASLALLIAGAVLFLGSIYWAGQVVWNVTAANRVVSTPLEKPDGKVVRENLSVNSDKYLQVTYTLKVQSDSTVENEDEVPNGGWESQFKFPFKYRLINEKGQVIHSESGYLSWDEGSKNWHENDADSTSGFSYLTFHLDKFSVKQNEDLRFEAEIGFEDPEYESELQSAKLNFYDNVTSTKSHLFNSLFSVLCLLGAVISVVLGLVFSGGFDSGSDSTGKKSPENEQQQADLFDRGLINFLLAYPFAAGFSQLMKTAGLLLISFLVVPIFIVFGYLYRLARSVALGVPEPPEYEEWWHLFKEGGIVLLALLPVIIPSIFMHLIPYFNGSGLAQSLSVTTYVASIFLVNFLVTYLGIALMMTLISTGSVTATYAEGRFIKAALTGTCLQVFLLWILISLLVSLTTVAVGLILIFTCVGVLLWPILMLVAGTYQLFLCHALLGYLYRQGIQKGKLPEITDPERLNPRI